MWLALFAGLSDTGLNSLAQNFALEPANTASNPAMARPVGVVKSNASVSDTTPRPVRSIPATSVSDLAPSDPSVQPPYQDGVQLPPSAPPHQRLSFWTLEGSRIDVFYLGDDHPATLGDVGAHRLDLERERLLVMRGHACVQTNPDSCRHLSPPAQKPCRRTVLEVAEVRAFSDSIRTLPNQFSGMYPGSLSYPNAGMRQEGR